MLFPNKQPHKNTTQIVNLSNVFVFIGENGVSLKLSKNTKEKPVYIDFSSSKLQHRQKNISIRKEAVARATGMKSATKINILDATAGLGEDSFILATLGANITMIERNPLIYLILNDALERGRSDASLEPIISRMQLISDDSINYLDNSINYDVVYMDPMFPDKNKTALNKKEMRLFRAIAGKDEDADMLFTKALTIAGKRVVVKRPAKSEYMLGKKPEFSIEGKASRFDVYIVNNIKH